MGRKFSDISYQFKNESDEEEQTAPKQKSKSNDMQQGGDQRRRREAAVKAMGNTEDQVTRIREHQAELARMQAREAAERYRSSGAQSSDRVKTREICAYPNVAALPKDAKTTRVFVDLKNDAVLLPLGGSVVPFHIATIKNVSLSKADEGEYTFLRINFLPPPDGTGAGQASFLREVTFRAANSSAANLNTAFRVIKELRKRYTTRESERKEREAAVVQERLVLYKQKRIRLPDVYIRPNLGRTRSLGTLEAHTNGFRFTTAKNEVVGMFMNVSCQW